jgi:hypothetical protein
MRFKNNNKIMMILWIVINPTKKYNKNMMSPLNLWDCLIDKLMIWE